MGSREERFLMRQRGAGARQLQDDDFGLALPGSIVPSIPSAPAASVAQSSALLAKTTAPAGRRADETLPTPRTSNAQDERQITQVDENGSATKKRKLSPLNGITEARLQIESVREDATNAEHGRRKSADSKPTSSGKKRKKRRSIGQQSMRKKRTSLRKSDTVDEDGQLLARGMDVSQDTETAKPQEQIPAKPSTSIERPLPKARKSTGATRRNIDLQVLRSSPSEPENVDVARNGDIDEEDAIATAHTLDQDVQDETDFGNQIAMDETTPLDIGSLHDDTQDQSSIEGPAAASKLTSRLTEQTTFENPAQQSTVGLSYDQSVPTKRERRRPPSKSQPKKQIDRSAQESNAPKRSVPERRLEHSTNDLRHDRESPEMVDDRTEPIKRLRGRPKKTLMQHSKKASDSLEASAQEKRHERSSASSSRLPSITKATKPGTSNGSQQATDIPVRVNTIPIHTYMPSTADFPIHIDEDFGGSLPPLLPTDSSSWKPMPNAPDILAQATREIVDSALSKVAASDMEDGVSKPVMKRRQGAIRAFGNELARRLGEMSRLLGANSLMARRIKHGKQAKDEFFDEVLEMRSKRTDADIRLFQATGKNNLAEEVRRDDEAIMNIFEGATRARKRGKQGSSKQRMGGLEFEFRSLVALDDGRVRSKGDLTNKIRSLNTILGKILDE